MSQNYRDSKSEFGYAAFRTSAHSTLVCPLLNRSVEQCVNDLPSRSLGPLTQELLDYWIQNPEAQGTVEAIVEWWLLEQRIQQAAAEVRQVLRELVKKALSWSGSKPTDEFVTG